METEDYTGPHTAWDSVRTGSELGAYIVGERLGTGSSGTVFEATHRVLGNRVAVKVLAPQHCTRADLVRRFIREGKAAAQLDHPHVAHVLDVGTALNGAPYLVMEFLQGETLEQHLKRVARMSVEGAVDVFVPIISAVAAAHDAGIVHRDLKPENIFLQQTGHGVIPKVLDFGLSKFASSSEITEAANGLIGTPYYSAPEQAQTGREVDARTDQFAIGSVLYECVTGQRAFEGDSLYEVLTAIVREDPAPMRKLVREIPADFAAVVERALKKNPMDRFVTTRALGRALLPFASPRVRAMYGQEFQASPVFALSTVPPPSPARTLWYGFGALGIALFAALFYDAKPALPAASAPAAPAANVAPVAEPTRAPLSPPVVEQDVYVTSVRVIPPVASIKVDGELVGSGQFEGTFMRDGYTHRIEVAATGYEPTTIQFKDAPPPHIIRLSRPNE